MNFDEIIVKESPGICRCCLSEGCYKDLGTEYTWMNETEVYADMLLDCFDIGITQHNDGPNGAKRLICEVCVTRLRDACNFKKQVLDSEKRFIDMLGRGEFRPKVLMYPPQRQMKEESAEEAPEDVMSEDVEYLEDMGFEGEEEEVKTEAVVQSTSTASTSVAPRPKRGRPRKEDQTPDKAKRQKVAKVSEKKINALAVLLNVILDQSTITPFLWHHGKYRCFYCPATFHRCDELKEHRNIHEDDVVDLTDILDEVRYGDERIKLDLSSATCLECSEDIKDFADFLDHLSEKHELVFDQKMKMLFLPFKLSDNGMGCLDCGQRFQVFGPLLNHYNKYHAGLYECELCGEAILEKNAYNHMTQMHAVITCKYCLDTFQTKYALYQHISKEHNVDDLKCPTCGEILANKYLKDRHMALVHDNRSLQIVCEICSKIFTRNNKYLDHKRRVHLKEKNCSCDRCGFETYSIELLRSHMVKHQDDRPFECSDCGLAFRRRRNLLAHLDSEKHQRKF